MIVSKYKELNTNEDPPPLLLLQAMIQRLNSDWMCTMYIYVLHVLLLSMYRSVEVIFLVDYRVLSGGRIRVSFARPRTRGRRRRGFDPNLRCYTCGEKGHFSRDCVEIWRQRRRNRSRCVHVDDLHRRSIWPCRVNNVYYIYW